MNDEELRKEAVDFAKGVRELRDQLDRFVAAQPALIRSQVESMIGYEAAELLYTDREYAMHTIQTEYGETALNALAVLVFHWGVDDDVVEQCIRAAKDTAHDERTRELAILIIGKHR